jgi:hypothetical protein
MHAFVIEDVFVVIESLLKKPFGNFPLYIILFLQLCVL